MTTSPGEWGGGGYQSPTPWGVRGAGADDYELVAGAGEGDGQTGRVSHMKGPKGVNGRGGVPGVLLTGLL